MRWKDFIGTKMRAVALLLMLIAAGLLALGVASCARQKVIIGDAHGLPQPSALVLPVPSEVDATSGGVTQVEMRNVLFHVDDNLRLGIRRLRGRVSQTEHQPVLVLDDKNHMQLDMDFAEIALTAQGLTILLNRYVFGYRGSPLKDLLARTSGNQIILTGTMHKLIDIPFTMTAELSLTPDHRVRIHTTHMKICSLDGEKLLQAFGMKLQSVLNLKGAQGVTVEGNDLLLDPLKSLPPPRIAGTMMGIRVQGDEVVQTFGSASADSLPLTPPVVAPNYIYFQGGSLRFGKLFMVHTDLLAIDGDPSDPFDFYLDYYHSQLVAGYHVTMPNYALVSWMPDFDDLGTAKGRVTPPPVSVSAPIAR